MPRPWFSARFVPVVANASLQIGLMALLGLAPSLLPSLAEAAGAGALPKGDPEDEAGSGAKAEAPADSGKTGGDDEAKSGAKAKPPAKAKAKPEAEASKAGPPRNCFLDLANPPGSNAHFSPDGKTLLLLAQAPSGKAEGKKADKNKAAPAGRVRYVLVEVAVRERQSKAILSLEQKANASLLTYGEPVQAIGAVGFGGKTAGCYAGPANVVSISFAAGAEDKAVEGTGSYQLVEMPNGRGLYDMKKNQILTTDLETFQIKAARKVPPKERPLYFDPAKKLLVTWIESGEHRGLAAYPSEDETKVKRLPFKMGDRVVQSGGRFAGARIDSIANTIEIIEVPYWSKVKKLQKFKITVPAAYTVISSGLEINFDKHILVVHGANYIAKQKWQRVFVFNYATGAMLGAVPVTGSQYLNYAGIDPTGAFAVIEVRDQNSKQTLGGKVFNIDSKTFDDLAIELPKEVAKDPGKKAKGNGKAKGKGKGKAKDAAEEDEELDIEDDG